MTRAIDFSELEHVDRKAMVKALFCVIFAVTTTVGYSKSQTSNLGCNTLIDVLGLSPKAVVHFLALFFLHGG